MTVETMPSFREFAFMRLAGMARKRSRQSSVNLPAMLQGIVRLVLHLAGFGLLTIGAFGLNMIAGYCVAGLSCFVLSTLLTNTPDQKGR
jgi:hypothetical protein